jgi:hypothetical protein
MAEGSDHVNLKLSFIKNATSWNFQQLILNKVLETLVRGCQFCNTFFRNLSEKLLLKNLKIKSVPTNFHFGVNTGNVGCSFAI